MDKEKKECPRYGTDICKRMRTPQILVTLRTSEYVDLAVRWDWGRKMKLSVQADKRVADELGKGLYSFLL